MGRRQGGGDGQDPSPPRRGSEHGTRVHDEGQGQVYVLFKICACVSFWSMNFPCQFLKVVLKLASTFPSQVSA